MAKSRFSEIRTHDSNAKAKNQGDLSLEKYHQPPQSESKSRRDIAGDSETGTQERRQSSQIRKQ